MPKAQVLSVVKENTIQDDDDDWVYIRFQDGVEFKTLWETVRRLRFFDKYKKSPILVDKSSRGFERVLSCARGDSSVGMWNMNEIMKYKPEPDLLPSLMYINVMNVIMIMAVVLFLLSILWKIFSEHLGAFYSTTAILFAGTALYLLKIWKSSVKQL